MAEQVRFARRHWGSAAASSGNSKTVHWTVSAPHGDVPFESPLLFIRNTKGHREGVLLYLAEQVRFELTDGFRPSHDFQSCPL